MPINEGQSKISLDGVTYHKPCPKKNNEDTKHHKQCSIEKKTQKYEGIIYNKLSSKTILNTYSKPEKSYEDINKYNDDNSDHKQDFYHNAYSHSYGDFNRYDNDNDYKQDFYHKFSDPWNVRNNVENNGYIVSEFGEVFSPEQIKYYKKLGYDINADSNIN